jgi:hypothetical protein
MIDDVIYHVYYNENDDIVIESFKIIANKSKTSSIVFYVHNINFDGMLILRSLFKQNIQFNMIKRELNIFSIKFEYLGTIIEFKCSYKLIPLSIKNLAQYVQTNKLVFPYKFACKENLFYIGCVPLCVFFNSVDDYNFFINNINDKVFDFKKESIKYCTHDILILHKILIELVNIFKSFDPMLLKIFYTSYSIPSFAHKIFFKKYNVLNISKKINLEYYTYIRSSYYGGRCEVFGNPKSDEIVHYYDFSGMYGQCMTEIFPYGDINLSLTNNNFDKPGFYNISFVSNIDMPVLPIHYNNKLMFANGKINGTYWYEEIKEFIKNGGIVTDIGYAVTYDQEGYVFKDFVQDFNKMRNLGGYKKTTAKLIINSLYGSFAMNEDECFTVITFSEKEFMDITQHTDIKKFYKINNCYLIEIYKNEKSSRLYNKKEKRWNVLYSERNVAYASIIASKARIKLYKAFIDVINDGGRILYCDTDSIFASFKENKINKNSGDVVKWSDVYNDACFVLPKFYALQTDKNEIIKIKGVHNNSLTFSEIKKKFYNNTNTVTVKNTSFYKSNYILKQNMGEKIIWLNKYNKRIFSKDKKITNPIYITL